VSFPFDDAVAWQADVVFNDRRRRGLPTGENDLWIAATALAADEILVTRNPRHFQAVRGPRIMTH
jgi:predicted nucleic acid-binding protein